MILYKKNIKIDDQIVKKMIDEIKIDEFFSKKDNHYTTFFSNGKIKPENILNNFYNDILTDVSKEFGFYKVSKFYNSMWAQVYPPHFGKHSPHSHFYGSVLFSWVHFIKPTSNKCFSFWIQKIIRHIHHKTREILLFFHLGKDTVWTLIYPKMIDL